jgi:succinoglycan biosynthesis protein ExoA
MPIRNEAAHLANALAAVRRQEYPGRVRIHMAIAPSSDGTEDIAARLVERDVDLVLIHNPGGLTPSALNLAISAGAAPVIVRVDGHSQLRAGYIRRAVETLRRTGAGNVGGMQVPQPTTPFEDAVATATTSWMGTGGAAYRTGGKEASVDTVYLGVFDRTAIESVNLFDESLIRNQDYELNIRLRRAGHDVIFDPKLSVGYTPRGTWSALSRQYREYGAWKAVVVRRHPASLRARQIAPAFVTAAIIASAIGSLRRPRLLLLPIGYAVSLGFVASRAVSTGSARLTGVLGTMHLSWGAGFLGALPRLLIQRRQHD